MAVSQDGERITSIAFRVEKHLQRRGDFSLKGPYETARVPADDSRKRALTGELNVYRDAIVAAVREFQKSVTFWTRFSQGLTTSASQTDEPWGMRGRGGNIR